MVLRIVASVLSQLVRTVHYYVGRSVVLERLEACGTRVLSVIQNRHMPGHLRLRQVPWKSSYVSGRDFKLMGRLEDQAPREMCKNEGTHKSGGLLRHGSN